MREIIYKYNSRGTYETEQDTSFGGDANLKITIEPHDFSLAIGGEVLRNTSFGGFSAVVSDSGEVNFLDKNDNIIARVAKTERSFKAISLNWQQDTVSLQFGHTSTVDNYPNCDGEYDRWSEKWIAERTVTLDLKNNCVKVN